jgi:hypothetical protein
MKVLRIRAPEFQATSPPNVSCGSNSEVELSDREVCFTLGNGHRRHDRRGPFSARLGHRRLAYSPGSRSGVGEIIAARRKKENGLGGAS